MSSPSSLVVSVLLPIFNGQKYLEAAIESVLGQSYGEFELNVIDDGSTDDSWRLIACFADSRIRAIRQSNRGLAGTLNSGLGTVRGVFLARQDQDDLMLPGRLAKQVEFLNQNPDCALVGSWSEIWVGCQPTARGHHHPASNDALRLELLFDNPFVHSSVMMRADVVRQLGGYSEDKSRQPPEDYELWSRIARSHRIANIPEVLTVYREVEGSMSRTGENPFLVNVIRISSENLAAALPKEFSADECFALASLYHGRLSDDKVKNLSRARALHMHKQAALSLGGEVALWSDEFTASFSRQHRHINSQFMRRRLPRALVGSARRIKCFLAAQMSRLLKGS